VALLTSGPMPSPGMRVAGIFFCAEFTLLDPPDEGILPVLTV
jgi:hypothetical protein